MFWGFQDAARTKITHAILAAQLKRHPRAGGDPGGCPVSLYQLSVNDGFTGPSHQWIEMLNPCVYILASRRNGTLYIGVTSALPNRMTQHKEGVIDGFTKKYYVKELVYYEMLPTMDHAICREKRLKKWRRSWKIRLIEQMNPEWCDLFNDVTGEVGDGPADIARQYR